MRLPSRPLDILFLGLLASDSVHPGATTRSILPSASMLRTISIEPSVEPASTTTTFTAG